MTGFEIWSGGQTGVDRAALDVARALGITTGGWVPRGRQAEDGAIPAEYEGLQETETSDPSERTLANVRDTQGTLVLFGGAPQGGTLETIHLALEMARPLFEIDITARSVEEVATDVRRWIASQGRPLRLNVAGPRASESPDVAALASEVLTVALS